MPDAPVDPPEPVLETRVAAPNVLAPGAGPGPRFAVGGVVSRTLRVWWAHAWAFSAISLAVFAPVLVGTGVASWTVIGPARAGTAVDPGTFGKIMAALLGGAAAAVAAAPAVHHTHVMALSGPTFKP